MGKPESPEDEPVPPEEPSEIWDENVRKALVESEMQGGVDLEKMEVGKTLIVTTENRTYIIEKREDGFYISGHPKYCPKPIKGEILGSNFGGSMMKTNFLGRGMYMEFNTVDHPSTITGSAIQEIEETDQRLEE